MSKKRTFFIIAGVLFLIIISSYFYGLVSMRVGDRDFALPGDKQISFINIIPPGGDEIVLQKDKQSQWWLDSEHRANEFAVRDLIHTIRHFSVRQPVPLTAKDSVNKKLEREGILVKVFVEAYVFDFFELFSFIKTHRLYNSFFVGEDKTDITGTYMRMADGEMPYIVYLPGYSGGLAEVFIPEKHNWIDPVIIDLEATEISKIKMVSGELPDESFQLKVYEDLQFEFFDLDNNSLKEKLHVDTARVIRFLSSFKDLYYEKLLVDEAYDESEKLIYPEYAFMIEVRDKYDNKYNFSVYRKRISDNRVNGDSYDPDRFYLEFDEGNRALAQYYVFGRILRTLEFFTKD